jgi:hypothetical protein
VRRVDLEQEGAGAGVGGDLASGQALVEDLVPEVLGGDPQLQVGMSPAGLAGDVGKGLVDVRARRHEHPCPLVGGGVQRAEPQGGEGIDHAQPLLPGLGAVIQAR